MFLTNCPHIWNPPVVFNGLVRSAHLAVMVTPRVAARPCCVRLHEVLFKSVTCEMHVGY